MYKSTYLSDCFVRVATDEFVFMDGFLFVMCTHSLTQWQNDHDVSILYLIYRWLSAIWFLAVCSCSVLDIGRGDEPRFENHYAKWWIDLTNWGLVLCSVQAWLGAIIVTQGLMIDRDAFGIYFESFSLAFLFYGLVANPNAKLMPNFFAHLYSTGMQRKVKKGVLRHAYWILNTTAIVYSFIISFFYWTMLHDPGKFRFDTMNSTIDMHYH